MKKSHFGFWMSVLMFCVLLVTSCSITLSCNSSPATPTPSGTPTYTLTWNPEMAGFPNVKLTLTPIIPPKALSLKPSDYVQVSITVGNFTFSTTDPAYQCLETVAATLAPIIFAPEAEAIRGFAAINDFLIVYQACGRFVQTSSVNLASLGGIAAKELIFFQISGQKMVSRAANGQELTPFGPVGGPTPTPTPVTIVQTAVVGVRGPTPTPPAPFTYTTASPGNGCDPKGGVWTPVNSTTQCGGNGTLITKTTTTTGPNISGWGEQRLQVPGYTFPANYSVGVTISSITDPLATVAGCAGISVHISSDGTSADTLQVCSDGKAAILSVKNRQEVYRTQWFVPASSVYILTAQVMGTTIILSVNGVERGSQAFSSTTSSIGLAVYWQNAGANAVFTNFLYTEG